MLRTLSIRDFVIVDSLELEFHSGFTVLTGETGAGKSILIDALALTLGERGDAAVVRTGCERADIGAEFDIQLLPGLSQWLRERDVESMIWGDMAARGGARGRPGLDPAATGHRQERALACIRQWPAGDTQPAA